MAKKLFAMESENLDAGIDAAEVVTPEEGAAAEAQIEVDADVAEVAEVGASVDEGTEAADQLEQVEELVADAVENGEGLDPVAAEAVRISIECICSRVGANPKAVYSLYATENFQSTSSRKANTKFALEGIGEFLKDLWKKIKAALTNLWKKVTAFWDKHISTLGQVKKAIDSMKKKVAESSGKFDGRAYVEEAPSSLANAFGFEGEITVGSISKIIKSHVNLNDSVDVVSTMISNLNGVAAQKGASMNDLTHALDGKAAPSKYGPIVGGITLEFEFDKDQEAGTVTMGFTEDVAEVSDKVGVALADKAGVKGILDDLSAIIANDIKVRDKMTKFQESFNKAAMNVEKTINETVKDKETAEAAKETRKAMKLIYAVNAKTPPLMSKVAGYNVKLAKAVLSYAALCLKNYK